MTTHGSVGLLGTLRELGEAFEDASAEQPPLLHELLVARYPRESWSWWDGFLADSYYPRMVLNQDYTFYRAIYPVSDWGPEWNEVFPDGERCSRFYGNDGGLVTFGRLAGHGYELMRALASHPQAAGTALPAAVRNPGFRPLCMSTGVTPAIQPVPSEVRVPYDVRGKFGWLDLVYDTAKLYPLTCQVRAHVFGDLEEERRDHHHSPEVYTTEAFATDFNIEVIGSTEIDIFALSARVIELWLAPPRPVELQLPTPINLWEFAGDASREGGVAEAPLDPSVTQPTWVADARELRWGAVVLKRYSKPAANQTTILSVFQEDDWPPVIDDPLPGSGVERTKRLGDAVRALNRDMLRPGVIGFERVGDGKHVRWRKKL